MASGWNPTTWSELVGRYSGPLRIFAAQWSSEPEDAVQEAFLELFRQTEPPERVSAWLFKVVKNKAISSLRKETRRRTHEAQQASTKQNWFEEHPAQVLDARQVGRLIENLAGEQREVLVTRIWGGLSFDEIAALTGLTRSTCHRRYHEAIEVLRKQSGATCPNTNL